MKTIFHLALGVCLSFSAARAQTSTLHVVEQNGTRGTRINLVFLSEGYTSAEMGKFETDVANTVSFLFTKEPWVRYRSYCNIYRIQIASNQSGTDSTYTPRGNAPKVYRDTYFQSGFVTDYIDRLNTISSTGAARVYKLLNKHVPEYDIPMVLVNSNTYGGSGGPIAVATTEASSAAIMEHELGHSFVRLTDEYDTSTPGYPATEFPNATAKTRRSDIRWKIWIDQDTPLPTPENNFNFSDKVGLFEGANYRDKNWYRPHDDALMRSLFRPPGSVTREAFVLKYYSKISPIDSRSPGALTQTINTKRTLYFRVETKVPSTGPALTINWFLDGHPTGETGVQFSTESASIGNGTHRIKAVVRDPTDWVRRDPLASVVEEVTWTLQLSNQIDPPVLNNPLPESPLVLALGSGLSLNAEASGPGPIRYEWLKNDKPFKPAKTTPALAISNLTFNDAATYTVKITNPGKTITYHIKVAVLDPDVSKLVVGEGETANLAFKVSTNPPPLMWGRGELNIINGGRYARATSASLQIKNVDVDDSGFYHLFGTDDLFPIELLVVTTKPDYSEVNTALQPGRIGEFYDQPFPLPEDELMTPNKFSAKLPAGLKIDPKTGRITGYPTMASVDQELGDAITFTVGNEFGDVKVTTRLLILPLPYGTKGSYDGLIARGNELGGSTGGRVRITCLGTGSFSGSVTLGTEVLGFKGILTVAPENPTSASGSFDIKPAASSSPLTINFNVTDAGDEDIETSYIIGKLGETNVFVIARDIWSAGSTAEDYAGYYTFAFDVPIGVGSIPKGHGFGGVTVDAKGKTVTAGRLPDGSSFTTTSHLGFSGEVLIYQGLYTTVQKGSAYGILFLTLGAEGAPNYFWSGSYLNWQRPRDERSTARTYAAGFGPLDLDAFGGVYEVPGNGEIVMDLPAASGAPAKNAALFFEPTLPSDPTPVNADVTLAIKSGGGSKINSPNSKGVSITIKPGTGSFYGSYKTIDNDPRSTAAKPPKITRTVPYQGMMVRKEGLISGYGFFLRDALPKLADEASPGTTPKTSPRESGGVLLEDSSR